MQRRAAAGPGRGFDIEYGPIRSGSERRILSLGHAGNRDDAFRQVVEIYLHCYRPTRATDGVGCSRLGWRPIRPAGGRRRPLSPWRRYAPVLIALRQQRCRLILIQDREVEPVVRLPVVRSHIEPLRTEAEIGRGEEPKIFAVRVPDRPYRVGEAVGDLFRLTRFGVADK